MPQIDVVRTYLQMLSPDQLRAAAVHDPRVRVARAAPMPVERYRALYREVGGPYYWRDREAWSDAHLAAYLGDPSVGVWVMTYDGDEAGFFELRAHPEDHSVEIVYFGLVGRFIGRRLGGHLLTRAVEEAWRWGSDAPPDRVWLHTCTLDGPAALPNYRARGFAEYYTQSYPYTVPDAT